MFGDFDGDKQEKEIDDISKDLKKMMDIYIILIKSNEVIEFDAHQIKNLNEF